MFSRPDQRQPDELRPIKITRNFTKHAPGSVLVEFGDTQVIVTATVEERVPRHIHVLKEESTGWLTAEYGMLPGATNQRSQRERLKVSGRTAEIQRLIGRTLRASVDMTKLGSRTINIDADVIQADGGTRVAAITGGYVALVDCLNKLKADGLLAELPPLKPIAAISVGLVEGTEILDLNYEEDSAAEVDANLVMNADGHIIELQLSSERSPLTRIQLDRLVDLGIVGIQRLLDMQQAALSEGSPVIIEPETAEVL
ncbi:MAG: ribonuclease [Vampirovibrio sp.]|jgi:ribonuclease PH|nr:ribonuclease [Vampirovibrio sp.]